MLEFPKLGVFGKDVKSSDRGDEQATHALLPPPFEKKHATEARHRMEHKRANPYTRCPTLMQIARHDRSIGIELTEVMGDVLIAPVTDFYIEMLHPTFDPDPLMQSITAPLAPLAIKQADFVFWPPPTMIDPVSQIVGMALQGIASDVGSPRGKRGLHRCCRSRSQPFIGVEAEHPLMGGVA